MSDEAKNSETSPAALGKAAAALGDSGFGVGLGMGMLFLCLFLPIVFIAFATHWDGHIIPAPNCFDSKEMNGKIYILNTCTGDIRPANLPDHKQP